MSDEHAHDRIDEILLQQGKVSEAEISAALGRQKSFGGKLCSHLFENSSASEEDLVQALSAQLGLPGVAVSGLKISIETLALIPAKVAFARQVLPFEFDRERNRVKIACVDPADNGLLTELNYILGDKVVQLHLSVELSLSRAINQHYGAGGTGGDVASAADAIIQDQLNIAETSSSAASEATSGGTDKSVLLVTDQEGTRQLVKVLLGKDGYAVQTVDSADKALDLIGDSRFTTVFIQGGVPGNSLDLVNRLRVTSPKTTVRRFKSLSDLLLDNTQAGNDVGKLHQRLDLFTSLLTIKERVPKSHSPRVGYLVDRLCRRLGLATDQRVTVVSAAYLHDQAKFYYMSVAPRDFKLLIDLVVRLLQSAYYEPAVNEILRYMYSDVSQALEEPASFNLLAGNILTVVDLYSENQSLSRRLTLDKVDEFKSSIQTLVGTQLLPNVSETFLALLEQEAVSAPALPRRGQIMLYSESPEKIFPLESRLKGDGFRTISALTLSSFTRLYKRSQPDLLVLHLDESPRTVISTVYELKANGVNIQKTPIFLMVKQGAIAELTTLLELGVEDIFDCEVDPDQIAIKIGKLWLRMDLRPEKSGDGEESFASKGNLSDMNLVELLQVLGPSRRTTKITIVPSARPSEVLEIYLEQGNIVFAQMNDFLGAEAIYVGLTWDEGTWTVESFSQKDIQEQNNQLSNEAILLEGCRLIDEMSRQV